MEWTPEALKAEIDYRQAALREEAARDRVSRRPARSKRPWWRRHPEVPEPRNGRREAA
ncbi:hypothetical protein [Saccharothrix syringae]|uniref:hypothetical protein n=1 Tax=Saccharothrix syringae TaxID=103733 RepID=UPI000A8BF0EF|nr:hypothetical protein [Saccharothrix syringae]